ncbi:MAG: hypothetical protein QOK14_1763 [Frankiaceae bacterium]|nr:hypothetical protein [Frankiaceae bacterium]
MPTRNLGDCRRVVETVAVIDVLAPTSAPHGTRPTTAKPVSDSWRSMVGAADLLLGGASPREDARPAADDLELTPALLSEAIVEWTGKAHELRQPDRDTARLVARYGRDDAQRVVRALRKLQAEFDETERCPDETRWLAADRAAATFAARHPELSTAAVEALRWCYAFDRQHRCELHGAEF